MKLNKNYKTCIFLFILIICAIFQINATSVTLLITQKDEKNDALRKTTLVFENSLMDFFFDNGVIISNEPIITQWKKKAAKKSSYNAAVNGFCNYVLAMTINYKKNASKGSEKILVDDIENIDWEVVDTVTDAVLIKGDYSPISSFGTVKSRSEAINDINIFAYGLGQQIVNSLDQQK
ncbi:MAG: hypothetical protein ACRC5H_05940 [Treponemataceae bacterium]